MKAARGSERDVIRGLRLLRKSGIIINAYRGGVVLRTPKRTTIFYGAGAVDWCLLLEIQDIAERDKAAAKRENP